MIVLGFLRLLLSFALFLFVVSAHAEEMCQSLEAPRWHDADFPPLSCAVTMGGNGVV